MGAKWRPVEAQDVAISGLAQKPVQGEYVAHARCAAWAEAAA